MYSTLCLVLLAAAFTDHRYFVLPSINVCCDPIRVGVKLVVMMWLSRRWCRFAQCCWCWRIRWTGGVVRTALLGVCIHGFCFRKTSGNSQADFFGQTKFLKSLASRRRTDLGGLGGFVPVCPGLPPIFNRTMCGLGQGEQFALPVAVRLVASATGEAAVAEVFAGGGALGLAGTTLGDCGAWMYRVGGAIGPVPGT